MLKYCAYSGVDELWKNLKRVFRFEILNWVKNNNDIYKFKIFLGRNVRISITSKNKI